MGYVRRTGRSMIERPAGRQFSRIHKAAPAAQTGIHVVGGRDDPYTGRIGAQDIVTLGRVSLENNSLLVQCLSLATVVAGGAGLADDKQAEQTKKAHLHGHGVFPNHSDFSIPACT